MAEHITIEEATQRIEQCYNRGVQGALKSLYAARVEAQTYTLPSAPIPEQKALIERLEKLETALESGAQNPLGDFNWDWL